MELRNPSISPSDSAPPSGLAPGSTACAVLPPALRRSLRSTSGGLVLLSLLFLGLWVASPAARELPKQQATFLRALARELELQAQQRPGEIPLWTKLGETRLQLGELDLATKAFDRARRLRPHDPDIQGNLAYLQFLLGNREQSRQQLHALAERFQEAPLVLYYLGIVESRLGNPADAERTLRRAHELKPEEVRIWLGWLQARWQKDPADELEGEFQQLFNRDPQNYLVRFEYARLLLDRGKSIAAVAMLHPLAKQHPDWLPGRVLLARAYWAANDLISTVFELEHLPLERLDLDLYVVLGKAKRRIGQTEDALRYLELALRKNPGLREAERELAFGYIDAGMGSKAEEILNSLLERDPNDYEALNALAFQRQQDGQYDRALELLDKMVKLDPSRAGAYQGLGYIALKRGDFPEAAEYLRQAFERDPRNAFVCEELGQTLSRLGDPDGAISYFRRSIEINPFRAEPHYMLGQLLRRIGRSDEAMEALAKAQQLSQRLRGGARGGMGATPPRVP